MKKNVDLTESSVFSGWRQSLFVIPSIVSKYRLPWKFTKQSNHGPKLVFTGYVDEIKYAKELSQCLDGRHCDRCGKSIEIKPWAYQYGLCKECNDDLEVDCNKLWRIDKKIMDINESNDRIVIELNYREGV